MSLRAALINRVPRLTARIGDALRKSIDDVAVKGGQLDFSDGMSMSQFTMTDIATEVRGSRQDSQSSCTSSRQARRLERVGQAV